MTHGFAYDGLVVSVEASEEDLMWLAEFMGPAFAVVPATPADVHISFEAGHELSAHSTHASGPVAFALDSRAIRLPVSPIVDGIRLFDAAAGMSFDVTRGGRLVRIVYQADRLDARVRLMRVVREYGHNHSIHTGGVMLHAAAVTLGDSGVAIVGEKGAGKTTLAMRLLESTGVAYVANDRVMVRRDGTPRAFGVPTVVSVRGGTRACFPEATAYLQQCGDYRENTCERHARGPSAPEMTGDIWRFAPHQLGEALRSRLLASATLASVLFLPPRDARSQPIQRLSRTDAAVALGNSILGGGGGQYTSDIFRISGVGTLDSAGVLARCEALASRIVCLRGGLSDDAVVQDTAGLLHECLDPRA